MDKIAQYPNLENCNPSLCISGRIRKCNRLIENIFRKHLAPFDITSNQLTMLFITAKKKQMTQVQLAHFLVLEKSTVSRNVRLLCNKDYFNKTARTLEVTPKGKALLEEVIPHWDEAMKEARQRLAPEGEAALQLILGRLLA